MPNKDTIAEWLSNDSLIQSFHLVQESGELFNYSVQISGWTLHVARDGTDAPLEVIGKVDFDAETLALLLDREEAQRNLLSQLSAVITSTDGLYQFLDGNGDTCEFEDMRSIQFQHRIYEDGATQHEVMTSLVNITKAMGFLSVTVTNMRDRLDDSR